MGANGGVTSSRGLVALAGPERNDDWDAFVARTRGGDLVQTTAWAATKRGVGLETDLVVVRDPAGRCVAGGLLVVKRFVRGIGAAYVARGPVADPAAPRSSSVALDAIVDRARTLRINCLIVQPPEGGGELDRELQLRGFQEGCPEVSPAATLRLDVTQSDEQLILGMRKARRRQIRRAVREAVDISPSVDVELFHRLHTATAIRQGFAPLSLEYLEQQWTELAVNGRLVVLIAQHAGQPVAGIWLTNFNGVVTFRLAGWDASIPSPTYINEALHWGAIQWARDAGARIYDLGGLDRAIAERLLRGDPLPAGFEHSYGWFKLGFGGTPVLFPVPRILIFNRLARYAVAKTGLLSGRFGDRVAHRFRNG